MALAPGRASSGPTCSDRAPKARYSLAAESPLKPPIPFLPPFAWAPRARQVLGEVRSPTGA